MPRLTRLVPGEFGRSLMRSVAALRGGAAVLVAWVGMACGGSDGVVLPATIERVAASEGQSAPAGGAPSAPPAGGGEGRGGGPGDGGQPQEPTPCGRRSSWTRTRP